MMRYKLSIIAGSLLLPLASAMASYGNLIFSSGSKLTDSNVLKPNDISINYSTEKLDQKYIKIDESKGVNGYCVNDRGALFLIVKASLILPKGSKNYWFNESGGPLYKNNISFNLTFTGGSSLTSKDVESYALVTSLKYFNGTYNSNFADLKKHYWSSFSVSSGTICSTMYAYDYVLDASYDTSSLFSLFEDAEAGLSENNVLATTDILFDVVYIISLESIQSLSDLGSAEFVMEAFD